MDPIEKAIRNAFEKGDPADPAFREKVYSSVAGALDRALKANPSTTVERAIARRRELEATVAQIEAEYSSPLKHGEEDFADLDFSVGDDRTGSTTAAGMAPQVSVATERTGTRVSGKKGRDSRVEPVMEEVLPAGILPDPPEDGRSAAITVDPDARRSRRSGARLAGVLFLILALLGAGGWWLISSGFIPGGDLLGSHTAQTAVGQDATTGEEEAVAGPLSENQETREWINIFNPQDPSTVSVPSGAEAAVQTSEGLKLLRIHSGQGREPIRFAVGQGVLEQLAGKKAVFDVVARADTEDGGNFSVECDFGTLGNCGRRRYAATAATRADFLLEVELPAGRPAAGGVILIDPDVTGAGKAMDIFEIRAAPSD